MSLLQAIIDSANDELQDLYKKQVACLPYLLGECPVESRCMAFSAMFWQLEAKVQECKMSLHRATAKLNIEQQTLPEPNIVFDEDTPF